METEVECAIAMVWPEGRGEPVCEMFRVDRRTGRWTSKHFSNGTAFADCGLLHHGETARSLAQTATRSGVARYVEPVTFVVASLDESLFEETGPWDWTVEHLKRLPDADVTTFRK